MNPGILGQRVVPLVTGCAGDRLNPITLGRRRPGLGMRFDDLLGIDAPIGDVIRLAGHGAMAVLGIHVGLTGKGAWPWIGWIVGVGSGVVGVMDLVGLIKENAIDKKAPEEL